MAQRKKDVEIEQIVFSAQMVQNVWSKTIHFHKKKTEKKRKKLCLDVSFSNDNFHGDLKLKKNKKTMVVVTNTIA